MEGPHAEESHAPVPVYPVDVSSQEGEVWEAVRGWLGDEGQAVDLLTFGANGALLLARRGAVVGAIGYVAGDRKLLREQTRKLFQERGV